ncbi:putative polypyrimidine tract-binding protein 2-like isoform X5 [Diplonema papillatum]|nr:putative polypyrimidine tract-binding protein 2-like isoform X5 [Diplonema papillatum]
MDVSAGSNRPGASRPATCVRVFIGGFPNDYEKRDVMALFEAFDIGWEKVIMLRPQVKTVSSCASVVMQKRFVEPALEAFEGMQVEGYHDAIRIAVADGSQKRGVELSASSTGTYTEADHQKEPEADGHLPDIISSHPLEPRQPHDALTGPGPYDANGSAIGYFQSQQSPAPAAAEQSSVLPHISHEQYVAYEGPPATEGFHLETAPLLHPTYDETHGVRGQDPLRVEASHGSSKPPSAFPPAQFTQPRAEMPFVGRSTPQAHTHSIQGYAYREHIPIGRPVEEEPAAIFGEAVVNSGMASAVRAVDHHRNHLPSTSILRESANDMSLHYGDRDRHNLSHFADNHGDFVPVPAPVGTQVDAFHGAAPDCVYPHEHSANDKYSLSHVPPPPPTTAPAPNDTLEVPVKMGHPDEAIPPPPPPPPLPVDPNSRAIYFQVYEDPSKELNVSILSEVVSRYGTPLKIKIEQKGRSLFSQGWIIMSSHEEALDCIKNLNGKSIFEDTMHLTMEHSKRADVDIPANNDLEWDYTTGTGTVLLLAGMTDARDAETCEMLFSISSIQCLLGVYGDVMRVKVIKVATGGERGDPQGQALVQLRTADAVTNATEKLHGCPAYGAKLRVVRSSNKNRLVPSNTEDPYYRESLNGPHRFGLNYPREELFKNTHPPSTSLFLDNLPARFWTEGDSVVDEALLEPFSEFRALGAGVVEQENTASDADPQQPGRKRKIAVMYRGVVDFAEIQDAVAALIHFHDTSLQPGEDKISVTFSNYAFNPAKHPLNWVGKNRQPVAEQPHKAKSKPSRGAPDRDKKNNGKGGKDREKGRLQGADAKRPKKARHTN